MKRLRGFAASQYPIAYFQVIPVAELDDARGLFIRTPVRERLSS
jgi:hypothetical protein